MSLVAMSIVIARKELRSMFFSPLAWTVLAVVQFVLAWLFLVQIDSFAATQGQFAMLQRTPPGVGDLIVAPLLSTASIVMLLVVPVLTMRAVAEEKRSGTIALLRAAPVGMAAIVIGKFLALLVFLAVLILLTGLMPLSLLVGTDVDLGRLASGLLGLWLVTAAFASVGLFMSSLTDQPVVAAVSTFGVLLMLWLVNATGSEEPDSVTRWLSLLQHYQSMLRGLFASADVIYYLVVIGAFLAFSVRRLDAERLQR